MSDGPRVLIVEDSRTQAWQLSILLEDNGFRPEIAPDIARARELLRTRRFELVVTDLMLPDGVGFDLCRQIKSDAALRSVPVLILTSETDPANVLHGLEAGAEGYMTKGRENDVILARVREAISRGAADPPDKNLPPLEAGFLGDAFRISATREHLVRFLLASFEDVVHLDRLHLEDLRELEAKNRELTQAHADLAAANERLLALATTDGLTGLFNHRRLQDRLHEEARRSIRQGTPIGAIMVDIDKFKSLNDERGHAFGDEVLRNTARVIADALREIDVVGRYGGEEFGCLILEAAKDEVIEAGERLRAAVEAARVEVKGEEPVRVTVSVGCASFPDDTDNPNGLFAIADMALYAAKRSGRNRVEALARHRFEYRPPREEAPTSVTLCGDFNGWNRPTHPLALQPDGSWRVETVVPTGRLRYKYHLDGETWIPDPAAKIFEKDIYHEPISVVVIRRP